MPSSDLYENQACRWHTYIHASKTTVYTNFKNLTNKIKNMSGHNLAAVLRKWQQLWMHAWVPHNIKSEGITVWSCEEAQVAYSYFRNYCNWLWLGEIELVFFSNVTPEQLCMLLQSMYILRALNELCAFKE